MGETKAIEDLGAQTRSVELLLAVLDNAELGVAVARLSDFVFELANPAFEKMAYGRTLVGERVDEVFPELGHLLAPLEALARHVEGPWRREEEPFRVPRRPGGPPETVYATFEVRHILVGEEVHVLVTVLDRTESFVLRKELEEQQRRQLEIEQRRARLAETLDGINRVIHSSLDYDEIMQRALEAATKALGARWGAVFLGLDDSSEARYVYGFPKTLIGRRFDADQFPFSRMMQQTKAPVPVGPDDMSQLMNPTLAKVFGVRSIMAIPLVVRDKLVGGIGLVYRHPHEFDALDVEFARSFGASLALALDNAELYRRQARVADTLQAALLTLPDHIEGLRFAHIYRAATEAAKVGGDFYDLFELEHDAVGITMGDVAGKGLDAAVLTSLVKNAVRAQATEQGKQPDDVMRVVNEVVLRGSAPEAFATVFFGVLDLAGGTLVYCNAGHTASAVLRRDGSVESLPANSSLVGALPEERFGSDSVHLERGDVLFAYTDGLIEAWRGKEMFGEERLFALLREVAGAEPTRLAQTVLDDVVAFANGRLSDDVAILALWRR